MNKITYKFVMDGSGLLHGVELWQGDQHILVSTSAEGTHKNGYRWAEIKDFMDNVVLPSYVDGKGRATQSELEALWRADVKSKTKEKIR